MVPSTCGGTVDLDGFERGGRIGEEIGKRGGRGHAGEVQIQRVCTGGLGEVFEIGRLARGGDGDERSTALRDRDGLRALAESLDAVGEDERAGVGGNRGEELLQAEDALKKDSRGLSRGAAGNPGFPRLLPGTLGMRPPKVPRHAGFPRGD